MKIKQFSFKICIHTLRYLENKVTVKNFRYPIKILLFQHKLAIFMLFYSFILHLMIILQIILNLLPYKYLYRLGESFLTRMSEKKKIARMKNQFKHSR
jgi:hypothetical protein